MNKCIDKGIFTCIRRDGVPKKKYETDKLAIEQAKFRNENFPKTGTKLVAYKCSHCYKYHLTTKFTK